MIRSGVILLLVGSSFLTATVFVPAAEGAPPDFDRVVAPLLAERCLECHHGPKPKGGLDLSRRAMAMEGGNSGKAVVPGKPNESLLWDRAAAGKMPPKKPLSAEEKNILRDWIASGAVWGTDPVDPFRLTTARRAGYDWWSLQPVRRCSVPPEKDAGWCRNPIDYFIRKKLESVGLPPSAPADPRTLIRRLYFDLLGLPPSPEEVAAFVYDRAPDAYDKLVDRLLASPHYGVRWARHWLDVVRFGESNGFEYDEFRPNAWPYRDWVVDAFNRDMPYDKFVRLQLAGDVLFPNDAEAIQATGFLVAGAYDTAGQNQQSAAMRKVVRQDELEDIVGTVGQTFLGLTVHCARCHDHKFDPIRQTEYYRLTAALDGVRHGERDLASVKAASAARAGIPRKAYAASPRPPEGVSHVLLRGNPKQAGEVVSAGGVASLAAVDSDFRLAADAPESERRKRLAAWITDPRNPLVGRVIVNRVWQYHFGVGFVDTPSDFGFNGGRPTHPELLDWLAGYLVEHRWSLKELHRLIVTSATYRQSGAFQATAAGKDAGARLLWRKNSVRLEAEALRDAMLCVAGQLNPRMAGPGFQDYRATRALGTPATLYVLVEDGGPELNRRTLYRTWARGSRSGFLDSFDCPDPSTTSPRRAVTTTPLQALALLNNSQVLRLSAAFADRLEMECGSDATRQIRRAYVLAFGREPDEGEIARARPVVEKQGLKVLARAIFNSNEFLYVD